MYELPKKFHPLVNPLFVITMGSQATAAETETGEDRFMSKIGGIHCVSKGRDNQWEAIKTSY